MFDPRAHPLLDASLGGADAALERLARLSERLLGLSPDAYDALGTPAQDVWGDAVALQMNHMWRTREGEALVQENVAGFQRTFRAPEAVCRAARVLVQSCLEAQRREPPLPISAVGMDPAPRTLTL